MVLPSTGNTISFNDIRIELGISSQSPFSIETAENGGYVALNKCAVPVPSATNPASISEWWSYDNNATSTELGLMDSNPTSCVDACAELQDGDVILYYNQGQTTLFTDSTCNTLAANAGTTYYADINRVYCYTVTSGTLISTCTCNGTC
jgi:hypothetical protein